MKPIIHVTSRRDKIKALKKAKRYMRWFRVDDPEVSRIISHPDIAFELGHKDAMLLSYDDLRSRIVRALERLCS